MNKISLFFPQIKISLKTIRRLLKTYFFLFRRGYFSPRRHFPFLISYSTKLRWCIACTLCFFSASGIRFQSSSSPFNFFFVLKKPSFCFVKKLVTETVTTASIHIVVCRNAEIIKELFRAYRKKTNIIAVQN